MGKTRDDGKTKSDRQFQILDERLVDIQGKVRNLRMAADQHGHSNQDKFAQLESLIESGFQQLAEAIAKIQPLPQTSHVITLSTSAITGSPATTKTQQRR